jgi:hypothetical protein
MGGGNPVPVDVSTTLTPPGNAMADAEAENCEPAIVAIAAPGRARRAIEHEYAALAQRLHQILGVFGNPSIH